MGMMRALVQHGSALISEKLGRCPKCMRLSLVGAITGWLVLVGISQFWAQFRFTSLLTVWPVSFTALWLLHILVYASREAVQVLRVERSHAAPVIGPLYSRRRMVGVFAGSTAVVVLATG